MSLPELTQVIDELTSLGITVPAGRVRLDGYGDSAALSAQLIALIVAGRKRAGTGLLWGYEHDQDPLPQTGDIEIVLDHARRPVLLTRLTQVSIVPFEAVDAEYAAIEGEGDGTLAYWRQGHWAYFTRECQRIGRQPSPDMPVICSVFELLAVVPPRPSAAG